MSNRRSPDMSVVIVMPDRYETIRQTIKHLRAQTVRDSLEVVIVAPSEEALDLDNLELEGFLQFRVLEGFLQFRVVEVGNVSSIAWANAAGIHQATAPVIALVEDHSYPETRWAEALIKAHQQPWAAVGPVLANANPATMISWANLLIEYGPWLGPAEPEVVDHLPGHNSAYKRAVLLAYGPELQALLEAETVLQWDLQARGYRLYLEPAAKTNHLNFSRPSPSLALRFHSGRLFAAARSRRCSSLRRLLYAVGAPLIPLVRLWRILQQLRRPGRPYYLLPRVLPALVVGLALDGAGEMVGYILGAGDASQRLSDFEFHRYRYLSEEDRRAEAGRV